MLSKMDEIWKLFLLCIVLNFSSFVVADVKQLTEDDWTDMLKGEWLVKFYAPWCPACKSLAPTWEKLGQRSYELGMKFATIDVTENPVLSGRFFITALPTIFHVKDGVFRQYKGARTETELVSFVRDMMWKEIEPVGWYRSPTSIHMAAVGMFFQFSVGIRNVHTSMTEDYGIPVWGSYIIFALATILIGLLIGLLIVFLCDAVHVMPSHRPVVVRKSDDTASLPTKTSRSGQMYGAGDANEEGDESDLPDDQDITKSRDVAHGRSSTTEELPDQPVESSDSLKKSELGAGSDSSVRRRETKVHDADHSED